MYIPNWSNLSDNWGTPLVEMIINIYTISLLMVCVVVIYVSFISNWSTRRLYSFGILFMAPHAFLMALLPSFYSLIGLLIWIVLSLQYRNIKNIIEDEKNGITSTNPKYRSKEEEAFKRLTIEKNQEWINQISEQKKIPYLIVILINLIPFLIGVYITSFI